MDTKKFYTPNEVARILGISKQTLMRYESRGFFPHARRNPINKWRVYSSEDIVRLRQILKV